MAKKKKVVKRKVSPASRKAPRKIARKASHKSVLPPPRPRPIRCYKVVGYCRLCKQRFVNEDGTMSFYCKTCSKKL